MLYWPARPQISCRSLHWLLLASQALALSCTALPIWWLAQAGWFGANRLRWLEKKTLVAAGVVFAEKLFDKICPETWVMPAFACQCALGRAQRAAPALVWLAAADDVGLPRHWC